MSNHRPMKLHIYAALTCTMSPCAVPLFYALRRSETLTLFSPVDVGFTSFTITFYMWIIFDGDFLSSPIGKLRRSVIHFFCWQLSAFFPWNESLG